MPGLDHTTGRSLDGWDHLKQSIAVILSTRIGERIMRRTFGAEVPRLLGEPLVPRTVLRFFTAIIVAIELWEPRYRIARIRTAAGENATDRARLQGRLGIAIEGEYRPRAHLGDFSPERAPFNTIEL